MKNQIVKKKRFQLAFASLPKEYHYYVKEQFSSKENAV